MHDSELLFYNYSSNSTSIRVKVYPVSMVFNGDYKYRLDAFHPNPHVYNYINSRNTNAYEFDISPNSSFIGFNHDKGSYNSGTIGSVSFGKYKIEVRKLPNLELVDTCTVEYDAGYPRSLDADLSIQFRDDNNGIGGSGPRLTYNWSPCNVQNINAVNKQIVAWNQCTGQTRNKDYGEMIYSTNNGNTYTKLPQDYRNDCGSENYPDLPGQWGTGVLTLNLIIDKNITTRLYNLEQGWRWNAPGQIVISPNCTLTINNYREFKVIYDPSFVEGLPQNYNKFFVKTDGTLYLKNDSRLIIDKTNHLIFEKNSKVIVNQGGYLSVDKQATFCNYGAIIINNGTISIKSRVCTILPDAPVIISGNGTFEVDSTEFYIPDSTTYTFDSNAVFLCKPYTKIIFGKQSKLVFQNGSRINASNCSFVSYDSTQTWDGIYLSGVSYDTLKNCTIQNAVNGINVINKQQTGFGTAPATEISNCVFKNSTSTDLLNYVYINNSSNVLIKGCSSEKTGSGKFTSGIVAEYCSANGVVICDNNINYVTTGISLIQSSVYTGRNTITGSTNSGTGIYLDNSNGTIEYNTVNNFQKSVYSSYSSPYLLKNTFSNAYSKNIELVSGSMPVMKPVYSSGTLRWLGGNNTITGTPSVCGISFIDCYPLIDSGYNRITVNGSDYLNGYFSMVIQTVNARINYWYDNPPNSSLFDITNGSAVYSNPFDGSTLPSTDGTELNSIGWGLYDTVFTKDMGDNPTPEDLFTQAYTEEMGQNYTSSIIKYKEVVSSYKTSAYAPISLSRIFNVLDKMHANISDYNTIQTYYSNIKQNIQYPLETRELSEDFEIKSKVKQYAIEEAISDYNTIYQNNPNNSKGTHALLNKICLENMTSGDALINQGNNNHKLYLLSVITGEKLNQQNILTNNQPYQYRLLQNYPNPFNPTTSIKYEIPKNAQVIIKVYDLLGKEVFSYIEYKQAGSYEVKFDGSNLASGMYFYSLEANGFKDVKKMVLIK